MPNVLKYVVALTVLSWIRAHATAMDAIRVYAIRPDCFDYLFTAVVSEFGDKPVLSFNHISGRTFFAQVGETVEEYTVNAFEPRTERVFNPSVSAYQEKKTGMVTLEAPDGSSITLECGKPLSRPGWMACLVSLDTGMWQYVGAGDIMVIDDTEIIVDSVSQDSVRVSVDGTEHTVPVISEEEKEKLTQLWEKCRRQREERLKVEAEKRKADSEKQVVFPAQHEDRPPSRVVEVRRPAKFFFGTEYRYPTEYEVIPVAVRTASGTLVYKPIVVPKRFATGTTGISINYR